MECFEMIEIVLDYLISTELIRFFYVFYEVVLSLYPGKFTDHWVNGETVNKTFLHG